MRRLGLAGRLALPPHPAGGSGWRLSALSSSHLLFLDVFLEILGFFDQLVPLFLGVRGFPRTLQEAPTARLLTHKSLVVVLFLHRRGLQQRFLEGAVEYGVIVPLTKAITGGLRMENVVGGFWVG